MTVVEYQKIFRDIISAHMVDQDKGDYMVGGPGCTIEIDESQYGQYKGTPPKTRMFSFGHCLNIFFLGGVP